MDFLIASKHPKEEHSNFTGFYEEERLISEACKRMKLFGNYERHLCSDQYQSTVFPGKQTSWQNQIFRILGEILEHSIEIFLRFTNLKLFCSLKYGKRRFD